MVRVGPQRSRKKVNYPGYLLAVTSETNDGLKDGMEPGNPGQRSENMEA